MILANRCAEFVVGKAEQLRKSRKKFLAEMYKPFSRSLYHCYMVRGWGLSPKIKKKFPFRIGLLGSFSKFVKIAIKLVKYITGVKLEEISDNEDVEVNWILAGFVRFIK